LTPKKQVDGFSEKPTKRGRPRIAQYTTVWGRAANYKLMLSEKWPNLGNALMRCLQEADVIDVFEVHAQPYARQFVPHLASDILELIRSAKFPQRANARIKYMAESLAGRPSVTLRTSREVCAKLRAIEGAKSPYKIIRKEFYIVCQCGYKGPGEYNACPKCHAQISFINEILADMGVFQGDDEWLRNVRNVRRTSPF
jgi:hypothetical protein